jgi:hypothetical protein
VRQFANFACIDWSGEAVARPKGLAVASASAGKSAPSLLKPAGGWSRAGLLEWFERLADSNADIIVGLDLSPAMPFADCGAYFPGWDGSPSNARQLWELVDELSADDQNLSATGFIQHAEIRRHFRQHRACGDLFPPGAGRMRVCEHGQKSMGLSPTSCFNLVGASQVGKSSLTGMRVLHRLAGRIPMWPFDPVPRSGPMIVEIYTTVAAMAAGRSKSRAKIRDAPGLEAALEQLDSPPPARLPRYDDHSTDALITAAWLRKVSATPDLWRPAAMTAQVAQTEGWTFGII